MLCIACTHDIHQYFSLAHHGTCIKCQHEGIVRNYNARHTIKCVSSSNYNYSPYHSLCRPCALRVKVGFCVGCNQYERKASITRSASIVEWMQTQKPYIVYEYKPHHCVCNACRVSKMRECNTCHCLHRNSTAMCRRCRADTQVTAVCVVCRQVRRKRPCRVRRTILSVDVHIGDNICARCIDRNEYI